MDVECEAIKQHSIIYRERVIISRKLDIVKRPLQLILFHFFVISQKICWVANSITVCFDNVDDKPMNDDRLLSFPPPSTLSLIPNGPLIFVRSFFLNKIKPNSIELSVIMRYLLNSVRCHIVKTCRFHMKNPFFGRYNSIYLYKLCYIWRIIPIAFLASKWKNGVKSRKKVTKWKILTKLFSSKKKWSKVDGIEILFFPVEIAFLAFRSTSFFNVDLWTTVVRYRLTQLVDLNFLSFTFLLTVFVACFRHCNRIMFVFLFNLSNVSVHMLAFTNGFHENPHIRFRTQIAPQPNIDQNQQYFTTFWKAFLFFLFSLSFFIFSLFR